MRISSIEGDPGYQPMEVTRNVKVFLDGVEITSVFCADEEGRYIDRYQTNEEGKYVVDYKKGVVLTERLTGTVRIEMG